MKIIETKSDRKTELTNGNITENVTIKELQQQRGNREKEVSI